MLIFQKNIISESFVISYIFIICVKAAPRNLEKKSWPSLRQYNIWESTTKYLSNNNKELEYNNNNNNESFQNNNNYIEISKNDLTDFETNSRHNYEIIDNHDVNSSDHNRLGKVLSFFPVSGVKEECSASDGRRIGTCLDVYECRRKGGQGKGECALGFGVCCIFVTSCDQEISTNITYLVSPNFPSFMKTNLTMCKIKIKLINSDISQLRIDFHHMVLGQPNRKTGICDGDKLQVFGGPGGDFTICGQNSGQHIYYDVGGRITSRQSVTSTTTTTSTNPPDPSVTNNVTLMDFGNNSTNGTVNMTKPILSTPTDTNDTEEEGIGIVIKFASRIIQTRFWEIRIMQIPFSQRAPSGCLQYFTGTEGIVQTFNFADNGRHLANQNYKSCIRQERTMCSITYEPCDEHSFRIGPNFKNDSEISNITPPSVNDITTAQPLQLSDPVVQTTPSVTVNPITPFNEILSTTTFAQADNLNTNETNIPQTSPTPLSDNVADETVEGSGNDADGDEISLVSTPAVPVRGGFDILSFFRSTFFDYGRSARQQQQYFPSSLYQARSREYFAKCTDRITMPCIVEDFIDDDGSSSFTACEPVHCGMQFCSSNDRPCRIESTVTPFYLGIHFGNGDGKGIADENIGACLKYNQMPCM